MASAKLTAPVTVAGSEAAAVWVSVAELKPWANNPRKNDKAVDRVADSIRKFGFGAPVIARLETREVIAGHTRLKAAAKLGIDRVPVRYLDLSMEDAHLLALADNKLNELATWDDELLAGVLQDLEANGVDLAGSGFAEHELTKLLADQSASDADDAAATLTEPEKLQAKWGTAPGQLWEMPSQTVAGGVHRVACGSSLESSVVARAIGGGRANMMWTDPPYGVAYVGKGGDALTIENDAHSAPELQSFLTTCFEVATTVLEPGSPAYIAHPPGGLSLQFRLAFDAAGFLFRQGLVWVKDSMVLGRSDYHYKHEPIMFGYSPGGKGRRGRGGDGWFGGNAETSVFEVDRPKSNDLHPTMKPVELVARMVRNSCPPKGRVYEPFGGSGTTFLAAESSSRICSGIELDPNYLAVILERMNDIGCEPKLCNG